MQVRDVTDRIASEDWEVFHIDEMGFRQRLTTESTAYKFLFSNIGAGQSIYEDPDTLQFVYTPKWTYFTGSVTEILDLIRGGETVVCFGGKNRQSPHGTFWAVEEGNEHFKTLSVRLPCTTQIGVWTKPKRP